MNRLGVVLIMFVLLCSCKAKLSSAQLQERTVQLEQIASDMEQNGYIIAMKTAYPLNTASLNSATNALLLQNGNSADRINLTDRNDFLKRIGNKVIADLSYFGERQIIASGYPDTDAGINFTQAITDYAQSIDEAKGTIDIRFTATDVSNEQYIVSIAIRKSLTADVNIVSSHRTNIRYTGTLKLLEATEVE